MKLYCVRHGEALSAPEDSQRPLSPQGEKDVDQLAQYLVDCAVSIPHIIHSPRLRAKQTAKRFAAPMDKARVVEVKSGLDESDPLDIILEELPTFHEDTMIVGHLPFLSRLVSQLVIHQPDMSIVRFAPATIVCLELHEAQRWNISWVLNPGILKRITASDNMQDLF